MGSDAGLSHLPRLPSLVEPRTERLQLRAWRPSDRDAFAALNADPEVMRYFPGPQSRAESDGFADRIESRMAVLGYGLWALETVDTGSFIGFTGLNPMPEDVPGSGGIEVGWRLARSAWGYGYATEAGRAALAVAFDLAAYDEVWSLTASTNAPFAGGDGETRAATRGDGVASRAGPGQPDRRARVLPHHPGGVRASAPGVAVG